MWKCFQQGDNQQNFEASYIYPQAAPAAAVVHQVAVGVARVVAVVLPPPLHPGTRARGTWHGTRGLSSPVVSSEAVVALQVTLQLSSPSANLSEMYDRN